MFLVGPKIKRLGAARPHSGIGFAWRTIDSIYGWWIPFGSGIATKTDTRIDALLWGCLAAVVYPSLQSDVERSTLRYGLWVVIGLVAATIDLKFIEFSIVRAILLPAMLLATAMSPTSLVSRFLELPVMKWIGRISYSLYIWQQLVMFPTSRIHSPLAAFQRFPYNLFIVFVLAAVSYYVVELPMIALGRKMANRASAVEANALGNRESSARNSVLRKWDRIIRPGPVKDSEHHRATV